MCELANTTLEQCTDELTSNPDGIVQEAAQSGNASANAAAVDMSVRSDMGSYYIQNYEQGTSPTQPGLEKSDGELSQAISEAHQTLLQRMSESEK